MLLFASVGASLKDRICAQVRLIDFNPIGGTTNPLLFAWEELGYADQAACQAAPENNGTPMWPDTEDRLSPVASQGPDLAESSEAAQPASQARSCAAQSAVGCRADNPEGSRSISEEEARAAVSLPLSNACGDLQRAGVGSLSGIEFRIVTEPNRVQPMLPTYGVPYDLIDESAGGACNELLQRLQEVQQQQTKDICNGL